MVFSASPEPAFHIRGKSPVMKNIDVSRTSLIGTLVSTLQIIFLFFLHESNLSQGTYPPQGGTEESTPQISARLRGGTNLSHGFLPVYRG